MKTREADAQNLQELLRSVWDQDVANSYIDEIGSHEHNSTVVFELRTDGFDQEYLDELRPYDYAAIPKCGGLRIRVTGWRG